MIAHTFRRPPASALRASAGKRPSPAARDACDVFHLDAEKVRELRRARIDAPTAAALAETFKVLGDVTRVRILDALASDELCVCDLATLLGMTESAVSHQLRLLRDRRIVRSRRAGRMVFYALDDKHIIRLFRQGLRHVQEPAALRRGMGSRAAHAG